MGPAPTGVDNGDGIGVRGGYIGDVGTGTDLVPDPQAQLPVTNVGAILDPTTVTVAPPPPPPVEQPVAPPPVVEQPVWQPDPSAESGSGSGNSGGGGYAGGGSGYGAPSTPTTAPEPEAAEDEGGAITIGFPAVIGGLFGGAGAVMGAFALFATVLAVAGVAWAATHPAEFQRMLEDAARAAGIAFDRLRELMERFFADNPRPLPPPPENVKGWDDVQEYLRSLPRGDNGGIRTVETKEELARVLDDLVEHAVPGSFAPTYKGDGWVLPDGTLIGIRPDSESGGRTIDIQQAEGEATRKIHVK
ncbi:hypothetical protein G4H71_05660 [Rhodococcus triatomae]|uniref:Uncharacterized protein n=1 Tax=Rhodococcus triatomae TaxID=300028 RepID=A0A1G8AK43_9NOCA|nr:hypothetical protein [Rhodococcus triatomae]QNG17745.1 hypothetical protein G4H72_02385 [Rhodococcus triatomae]QNG22588.1 hypothetical protein G4H71_05660 [Rhodococcus triatomae]SDH21344.1 hypothetical protein SAMN05444695_101455 [Rhodococcus triatomae]